MAIVSRIFSIVALINKLIFKHELENYLLFIQFKMILTKLREVSILYKK